MADTNYWNATVAMGGSLTINASHAGVPKANHYGFTFVTDFSVGMIEKTAESDFSVTLKPLVTGLAVLLVYSYFYSPLYPVKPLTPTLVGFYYITITPPETTAAKPVTKISYPSIDLDAGDLNSYDVTDDPTKWKDLVSGEMFRFGPSGGYGGSAVPDFSTDGGGCIILNGGFSNSGGNSPRALETTNSGSSFEIWIKPLIVTVTTSNITVSGEQTVNGISLVAGQRVYVNAQTDTSENGIYIVETGAWTKVGGGLGGSLIRGPIIVSLSFDRFIDCYINEGANQGSASTATQLPLDSWTCWSYTTDGLKVKTYKNGVYQGTVEYWSPMNQKRISQMFIGGFPWYIWLSESASAKIATLKLWKNALTDSEILESYSSRKARFGH